MFCAKYDHDLISRFDIESVHDLTEIQKDIFKLPFKTINSLEELLRNIAIIDNFEITNTDTLVCFDFESFFLRKDKILIISRHFFNKTNIARPRSLEGINDFMKQCTHIVSWMVRILKQKQIRAVVILIGRRKLELFGMKRFSFKIINKHE
jgi:hypothetical protein